MDGNAILNLLTMSLSNDNTQRYQAEVQLKQCCKQSGFLTTLFQITMMEDQPQHLRMCASIFLKNSLSTWYEEMKLSQSSTLVNFSQEEQNTFKENIIQAMVKSQPDTRRQLLEIFKLIANAHFPRTWPNLIAILNSLFESNNLAQISTGISCLMVLIHRFTCMRTEEGPKKILNAIIIATFPKVFPIYSAIVAENAHEAVGIQNQILRLFALSTRITLPDIFLREDNILPWVKLTIDLFNKDLPGTVFEMDMDDQMSAPEWTMKKHALKILLRLYLHCALDDPEVPFYNNFRNNIAPTIQINIIQFLANMRNSNRWLHPRVAALCVKFLHKSIEYAVTYKALKDSFTPLLQQVIFPFLSLDEQERELLDDDPIEFVRNEYDVVEEYYSPRKNAEDFLADLFKYRSKENMMNFMQFLIQRLDSYNNSPVEQRNPLEKFAAMSAIACLSDELKAKPEFKNGLEDMIAKHIFPEFNSPHNFLRAKACMVFSKFSTIRYQNPQLYTESLGKLFQCMTDSSIAVKLFAGITLRNSIQNSLAHSIVQQNLEPIFNIYIQLVSEVDNEEIIESMEYLISHYKHFIAPFACNLIRAFMISFQRVIGSESEDASIAAWECMRAIKIVLGTIDKCPAQFQEAENLIMPIITQYFDSDNEYFEDFVQIVSTFAIHSERVSDSLWNLFPVIADACLEWAIDYIKEVLCAFDNMICSDPEGFIRRGYINYIIRIYELSSRPEMDEEYHQPGCQLMECAIQNSGDSASPHIESVLLISIRSLVKSNLGFVTQTLVFNLIGNCLFFHTQATLRILQEKKCLQNTLKFWFQLFAQFRRVYDRKVAVLGLSSILTLPSSQWPEIFKSIPTIKSVIFSCIRLLDANVTQRKQKAQELQEAEERATNGINSALRALGSASSIVPPSEGYNSDEDVQHQMSFEILEQNFNFTELQEEFEDEDSVITAIDNIEEITLFFDRLQNFSQNEPQLFGQIMATFSETEQALCNSLSELNNALKK